jgi:hypothetical protein
MMHRCLRGFALAAVAALVAACGSFRLEPQADGWTESGAGASRAWASDAVRIETFVAEEDEELPFHVTLRAARTDVRVIFLAPHAPQGEPIGTVAGGPAGGLEDLVPGDTIAFGPGSAPTPVGAGAAWVPPPRSAPSATGSLFRDVRLPIGAARGPPRTGATVAYELHVVGADGTVVELPLRFRVIWHDTTMKDTLLFLGGVVALPILVPFIVVRHLAGKPPC